MFNLDSVRRVLLACLLVITANAASATDSFEYDGITYNITSSDEMTVEVGDNTSYSGTSVTIPETVEYDGNTYTVTSIGEEAFNQCKSLSTITLPESITSISHHAFYNCSSLTSVTLPESLNSIDTYTFYNCSALQSVDISKCTSLTTIDTYAFRWCSSLTSVTFPSTLISIGTYAFYNCSKLAQVVSLATSAPSCGNYAFPSASGYTLYVLEGNKSNYTDDTYWSTYFTSDNTEEITTIKITAAGTASYSHVQATESTYLPDFNNVLDLGNGQSMTAYTISEVAESDDDGSVGTATLIPFTGTLAEGKGLIVKSGDGGACTVYAVVNVTDETDAASDDDSETETTNLLKATTGEKLAEVYIFGRSSGQVGFYYFDEYTASEGKAYLEASSIPSSVKSILFVYDDDTDSGDTTGISEVATSAPIVEDNVYYTLSGMRVNNPSKGIYIVNGKKVIIK